MEFIATKKFELVPIGKIRFSFKKRKGCIWIGEVNIMHDTTLQMDKATLKMVLKTMKENKTDILTDGKKFYTRIGESGITQIEHPAFYGELTAEEHLKAVKELLK